MSDRELWVAGPVTAELPGTPDGVEPAWWQDAPDAVATCLSALDPPGREPRCVPHLAVREYCDVSARLFLARAAGVRRRMRPSASLELEPTRLLLTHGADTHWSGRACVYVSPGDVGAALRGAVASVLLDAAEAQVVVQVTCSHERLRVTAVRLGATADGDGPPATIRGAAEVLALAERPAPDLAGLCAPAGLSAVPSSASPLSPAKG